MSKAAKKNVRIAAAHTTTDSYHASFPPEVQLLLEQLRQAIRQAAPKATETISYGIPTFRLSKNLVHYAAHKAHIGLYPGPAALAAFSSELAGYKSSKGAVQFPLDKPLPLALVKKIVRYGVAAQKAG